MENIFFPTSGSPVKIFIACWVFLTEFNFKFTKISQYFFNKFFVSKSIVDFKFFHFSEQILKTENGKQKMENRKLEKPKPWS